jgi:hypothetical protein
VFATASNGYGTSAPSGHASVQTNPPPLAASASKGAPVNRPDCTTSSCAWIQVNVSNAPPNAALTVECWDSSGKWFTYAMTSDGSGSGSSQGCYYGWVGQPVWVVVSGTESNHLIWS